MDKNQEKQVTRRELSPESRKVVSCMREQIETGAYPGNDVIDETVEILLPVLMKKS